MPFDGNGNATVTRNIAVTGQTVLAEQVNTPFADIQNMLGQLVLRSGVAPMTGPLNSNGFRQLNVGDPESDGDGANKSYVDDKITSALSTVNANARKIETVNANRLALLADKATSFRVTGARTITLTAAATLLANWWCEVWAVDSQVIIDPDAAETINGNATLVLSAGQKAVVFCTGTVFFAFVTSDAQSGLQLQGYSFGLGLSNNGADAANDVDILSGKAASDTSPFNLMVLSGALTKRIDASWAVGSGNGGLDTGGVLAAGTYYLWLIQRSDTLVVDALFSLSDTAPTMPTSYERKRLIGSFTRTASVNAPINSTLGALSFTSAPQTITLGSTVSVAHGLGAIPAIVQFDLVCNTAEFGWTAGQITQVPCGIIGVSGITPGSYGVGMEKTSTNIIARFPNSNMQVPNKASNDGTVSTITPANWRLVVRAKL